MAKFADDASAISPNVADGAGAVALLINNRTALTATSKAILDVENNGTDEILVTPTQGILLKNSQSPLLIGGAGAGGLGSDGAGDTVLAAPKLGAVNIGVGTNGYLTITNAIITASNPIVAPKYETSTAAAIDTGAFSGFAANLASTGPHAIYRATTGQGHFAWVSQLLGAAGTGAGGYTMEIFDDTASSVVCTTASFSCTGSSNNGACAGAFTAGHIYDLRQAASSCATSPTSISSSVSLTQ